MDDNDPKPLDWRSFNRWTKTQMVIKEIQQPTRCNMQIKIIGISEKKLCNNSDVSHQINNNKNRSEKPLVTSIFHYWTKKEKQRNFHKRESWEFVGKIF